MDSLIISIVRTIIPYLVGLLAAQGIVLSDSNLTAVSSLIAFTLSVVYYVVVRFIEKKYPKAGYFLGVPVKPIYKETK